jgi:hypothetical protein
MQSFVTFTILIHGLFWGFAFGGYVEGIDTTELSGYGLDSAFKVDTGGDVAPTSKSSIALYGMVAVTDIWGPSFWGLFGYSFDEINLAPPNGYSRDFPRPASFTCFVIRKNDSTYCKAQIISKLAGNRFVYRFGTNTTPNDRILKMSDYDRSIRYKPNNFANHPTMYGDTFSWEPPIPNDNHFLGYIVYLSKQYIGFIDTSTPINLAQWDSIGYYTSTRVCGNCGLPAQVDLTSRKYYNLVADYTEGRSDFLKGWTYFQSDALQARGTPSSPEDQKHNPLEIINVNGQVLISCNSLLPDRGSFTLSIYTVSGQCVAHFGNTASRVVWDPHHQHLGPYLYIARSESPDHAVFTQPFMYTR